MSRHSKPLVSLFASAILLLAVSQVCAQTSTTRDADFPHDRIVGAIDESDSVTLEGNTHPLARPEFDRGIVPAGTRLERLVLLMRPSAAQQNRLDELTASQQDKHSQSYQSWLSPEEYAANFGVSEGDLARTAAWLQRHGFNVEPLPAGHRIIIFSGNAGQVAETFHSEIHRYVVRGQLHISNVEDPQIPKALSPVVGGILSLHDFRRASQAHLVGRLDEKHPERRSSISGFAQPGETGSNNAPSSDPKAPENTEGNAHYLFPADFATIYDLNPLFSSGQSGNGIAIAIVGRSNINLSDVSTFRSYAGLPVNAPSIVLDGPDPGQVSGDQDEATLDVEWAGGVAPSANVTLVAARSTASSDGVDLAAQYIVNHRTALVMSTSFGSCETSMGATEVAFYNSLWQQASAEGISAFVSSGDSGASGCDSGSTAAGTGAAVNGLCSPPYATCVGGTEFVEGKNGSAYWNSSNGVSGGSALSYIPEEVWNESASNGGSGLWASGGGISQTYVQPTWQKSVTGANSNGMRAVPDVALNAAAHDGYLVELNGNWYDFAGTSASSPTMAAIMALVVQHQAGAGQGNVNSALYGLLSAGTDPFHATLSGNNSVPGVGGFVASGAPYNLATGLGSVDGTVLVNNWPTASSTPTSTFSLNPSVSTLSVGSGSANRFSLSLSGSGGFSGLVSLTASKLPLGVSVQFSPSVVRPGSTSTVTVTASNSAAAGTASVLLTGTSGGQQESTALPVSIQTAPSLTIGLGALQLAIQLGNSAPVTVNVNTGGSFSGLVKLAVTGLPTGISASWSQSSFQANGAASVTSTLTLTASSGAAVNTSLIKIIASGDGLSAQAVEQIQVTAPPGLTLALAPAVLIMKTTGVAQTVVNVAPAGGLTLAGSLSGANFQALSLPQGVTQAWSKPTLTASGAIQTVLTLVGSNKAVAGSSSIVVNCALTASSSTASHSASMHAALTITK